jgi:Endonuclease-reverse transcriptase
LTIDKEKTDIYCISEAGQHAQEGHKDLSDMQAPGFTLHLLEAKRPGRKVACGMIIGVKSSLVSKFSVVHTMGTQDDNIEIACVEVWMGDRKTTVYMVYNPPLNKPAALESLPIARNTIIIGDFNAPNKEWDYNTTTEVGRIVEEFAAANSLLLIDPDGDNRWTNLTTNRVQSRPDLTFVHTNLADDYKQENLDCPSGLGHKIIMLSPTNPTAASKQTLLLKWNFQKANWEKFKENLDRLSAQTKMTGHTDKTTGPW